MNSTLLHEAVMRQALRTPDAPAVTSSGWHTTYWQLDDAASRLAGVLRDRGVRRGDLVGVALNRSADAIVAILAVLRVGAAYLPLDPEYPRDRLQWMVSDAAPAAVIVGEDVAFLGEDIPSISVHERGEAAPLTDIDPADAAYVIYTSGSTGTPKGVVVPHRGIANRITWELDTYPVGPGDAVLHRTSLSFDISLWEVFVPLAAGARVVVADPGRHQDPGYLVRLIAEEGITTIALVPSLLRALLDHDPGLRSCPALRDVHCGGERLPQRLRDEFLAESKALLHNLYGPTEYSIDATYWDCEPGETGPVPIGRPIAGTRLYVVDAQLRPVDPGTPGELCVAGAGLALGYLGRPDLTEARFVPDPFHGNGDRMYRTGDIVRCRDDGVYEFIGRADDQVKIRGHRIELGELEAALAELPGVRQAVAHTHGTEEDLVLVGYVVADDADPADLRRTLAGRIPAYLVPSHIVLVPEIPLGPTGKVDRAALPAPELSTPERPAPADDAQAKVAAIFTEVLGRRGIGSDDDFFELGGNSLQAVRLVNKLRKAFDADLSLPALFETSTVAGISKALASR